KLDQNLNIIAATDTTTPVRDRVFFMGLDGGFEFPGIGGLTIRLALSELGPLGVFINASVPGGILLEPNTGLAINDFAAGVEFFKTLPSIEDPFELRNPAFGLPTNITPEMWLDDVKRQVVNQYKAILANPGMNGFTAAFTAPMTITGSAKLFTIYASETVFNGQVIIKFSTDGKFLIAGRLNFAGDNISLSAKLYADLSKVTDGNVVVLFLADVPDQVRLLTLHGKLKMGFLNAAGEEVTFDVVNAPPMSPATEVPHAMVADPGGNRIDVSVINDASHLASGTTVEVTGQASQTYTNARYIDVIYMAPEGANLDYSSILDADPEFTLTVPGVGTVAVEGVPVPIETNIAADGSVTYSPLTPSADDMAGGVSAEQALINAIKRTGTNRFRYFIKTAGFDFPRGELEIVFAENAYKNADVLLTDGSTLVGAGNAEQTVEIRVEGATAIISNPGQGGRIDLHVLNQRNYLDVIFLEPAGVGIARASITDLAPEFTLSGPGLGTVRLDEGQAPLLIDDTTPGQLTYRYWISGEFAEGTVTLTFLEDSWSYLATPAASGGTATLHFLDSRGSFRLAQEFIDIEFAAGTDPATITSALPSSLLNLSVVGGSGNWTVTLDDTARAVRRGETNTYRFKLNVGLPAAPTNGVTVEYAFNSAPGTVYTSTLVMQNAAGLPALIEVTIPDALGTGFALDGESVLDLAREFNLTFDDPTDALAVTIDDLRAPLATGDPTRFKFYVNVYAVESRLPTAPGTEVVLPLDFIAESWSYRDAGAIGTGTQPGDTVAYADLDATNNRSYIDITFFPSRGQTLDLGSITDGPNEFSLSGVGAGLPASRVAIVGAPSLIDEVNHVYRYYLENDFVLGDVTVTFVADGWTD
ncbi:MAG TPA: hypothetical protein VNO52_04360, partial [Methylomirabilota bacterium]|nr:hypothetical protein [Methylomirabilota bacterium]